VALGAIFVGLGAGGATTAAAVFFALGALACGLLGCVVLALWTVTNHPFAHYNENLLAFNPLSLALVVLLPLYMLSGRAARPTRIVVFIVAGLSVLAALAHVVLASRQVNLAVIGLALPPTLAIAYVTWRRSAPRNASVC